MITPLFSILIANYNNGCFLEEALESIYRQSYNNWEVIIVDDHSDDNSFTIYNQLKNDDRIKIYYNNENHGAGFAKRKCVEMATGKICGFLDPDDALLPNALTDMVKIHTEKPEVSLVFSRFYFCNENLETKSECRLLNISENKSYFTNRDYGPEHFASFKKSCYDKTTGISPNYQLAVDQDLYFKLEETGDVYILNKFTYKYRSHKNGISASIDKATYWNLIVRHDTCLRRNLNPNNYPLLDFEGYIHYVRYIIYHSRSYRLGHSILKPINKIRQMLHI